MRPRAVCFTHRNGAATRVIDARNALLHKRKIETTRSAS
ncbi:hypothetical protein C7S16_0048 [Burkholderia thailandensis]|uniref:Uncharacterized protein n=1 Tax=Burkholderia thailandensis TaxID=57975 RepID=A0AAW9CSZ3_BURTH|nr:hypothetical protein [Burkholderia thailandensis]